MAIILSTPKYNIRGGIEENGTSKNSEEKIEGTRWGIIKLYRNRKLVSVNLSDR